MKDTIKITVIGGGSGGIAAAADLTIRGFQVTLYDFPRSQKNLEDIQKAGGLHLETLPSNQLTEGFAKLHNITTDIEEALREAEVIFVVASAFLQSEIAKTCAPFLKEHQMVVLTPGNFGGSIHFLNELRQAGCTHDINIGETECMMYACRKKDPTTIWIRGYKHNLGFSAFPAQRTNTMLETLKEIYQTFIPRKHVLQTGLSNPNTFVHAPVMLFNLSNVENGVDILMYHKAFTDAIGNVVTKLDEERLALNVIEGLELQPMPEIVQGYYTYQGAKGENMCDLHRTNPIFSWTFLPKTLKHRYFTEDVPFGLVSLYKFAEHFGTPCSTIKSIIDLSSLATGVDCYKNSRDLQSLGLETFDAKQLLQYVLYGD